MGRRAWVVAVVFCVGCDLSGSTERTREQLRNAHLPRIQELVHNDIEQHQAAVDQAADKLTPGFRLADPARQEREMRAALRVLQDARKGIPAFVASPMSFLAAVDAEGVVVARDRNPDRMKGQDFQSRFEVVAEALQGSSGMALGEFFAKDPTQASSWSILFAAPADRDGEVEGAVLVGIPLSRLAQRLSRQLRVESAAEIEKGLGLWVYLYKGDRVFHWDTPPDVDVALPDPERRSQGLASSPNGFEDKVRITGELYLYGVYPLPELGPDVGVVVFRSEP